ncbi:MAG TPA: hypothetical protein VHY84_13305 [Bryobacteraceae bacterium]|jgi:hypothetical protein|nr:hypothetical protein [Bryobacteraceae bacterium]
MARIAIPRIQGFEIHEQKWLPATLRNALTEWLRVLWEYSRAEIVIAPLLEAAVASSGAERIVDLCSGRSGPVVGIQAELLRRGMRVPVVLTDKFPDREALTALSAASRDLTACLCSIDATSVPEKLSGFRTLFNSFHHFRPADARRILDSARAERQPIGIFEITERTIPKLVLCFPASFLSCFLIIWRMRPRRVAWWLLTWVVPAIPFIVGWDAFVSHLRSYTHSEMRGLTRGLDDDWQWQEGRVTAPRGGVEISFLVGIPVPQHAPRSQ